MDQASFVLTISPKRDGVDTSGTVVAPDWIEILPAGPTAQGADGRSWSIPDPEAVITATKAMSRLPLVVDFAHATEKPELAHNAGAAGWVEGLQVRAGSIWGRVEWTPKGQAAIENREYRFVSPVFDHSPQGDKRIIGLVSIGLVHQPNFRTLKALNDRGGSILAMVLAVLGLPDTADEGAILEALRTLKSANAASVDLTRYVPVKDFDDTLKALNEAQAQLQTRETADKRSQALLLVEEAVRGGKITPALKARYVDLAINSFDHVKAMVDLMPVILTPGESVAARAADISSGAGVARLTDTQRAICAATGLSEEAYLKAMT